MSARGRPSERVERLGAAPTANAEAGPGTVVLQDGAALAGARPPWLVLRRPAGVVEARAAGDVTAALAEVRAQVARGRVAAGFLAYEAAPAFDPALRVRPAGSGPLLWFGLYDAAAVERRRGLPRLPAGPFACGPWTPEVAAGNYAAAVARVRELIADGWTYQVNLSQRLRAPWGGDPWALFARLCRRQRARHAAFAHAGAHVVCSASPELFFALDSERVVTRPMKGTAPRGARDTAGQRRPGASGSAAGDRAADDLAAADLAAAEALRRSEKDRAENVMIVDMVRNDLGRVARFGTVRAERLFEVEGYPTVWQMVSTVAAETVADPGEILAALFPCASITGAPKVSAMRAIADLETSPRGVYTGCIGYWAPGRRAAFNVAIRTVEVDLAAGQAAYGTGGGVVWDSTPAGEAAEILWKAAVLPGFRAP